MNPRITLAAVAALRLATASTAFAQTTPAALSSADLAQAIERTQARVCGHEQVETLKTTCLNSVRDKVSEMMEVLQQVTVWGDAAAVQAFSDAELSQVDPEGAFAHARALSAELDPGAVPPPNSAALVATAVTEIHGIVAKEHACRIDKKCMKVRADKAAEDLFFAGVVSPMCVLEARIANARKAIAKEKANPGGVVDLGTLHDLGTDIQEEQREFAELQPQYVARRHHGWPGRVAECR